MKNKLLTAGLLLTLATAAACSGDRGSATAGGDTARPQHSRQSGAQTQGTQQQQAQAGAPRGPEQPGHEGHGHGSPGEGTPAFITEASELKSLKPTLSPELFQGKQRLGYIAAREIPQTLAQLPCYCHCDKGFGHKSLQSCFVDDHAAHCAVCIDEALIALRLEKQEGLKRMAEDYR